MNDINFLGKENYPLTSQTMDMLKEMAKMGAKVAGMLGGENYIVSGCVDTAGVVSDGIIVIEGMPYVFEGGNKKAKLSIKEEKISAMAFGVEYPEARTKRSVVFSDNGAYNWGDFSQMLTNKDLEKRIESIKGTPLGIPEMWVGYLDKIPENYHLCDGTYLSQETYPDLFKVIGTIHGSTSQDNFALPDMRKLFTVGFDNQTTDYNTIGKKGGAEKVVLSKDEMPEHSHAYTDDTNAQGKYPQIEAGFPTSIAGVANVKSSAESSGWGTVYSSEKQGGSLAHENRPPYFVVAYIMKLKD